MASTVDQGTDLLWRGYAKQITQKLAGGGSLGKHNAVYICPLTTQGIAAGEHIFPEVTNNQLFRAVDSLLDPTSPVYVPGEGSYFNTVSTYLKYVMLNKNPSNEAIIRLTRANKEDKIAQVAYDTEYDNAMKRYERVEGRRCPDSAQLQLWARTNFPSLARKKEAQQSTAATVDQILDEINGPGAGDLTRAKTAIDYARDSARSQAGLNMPCIAEDVNKIESNRDGSSGAAKNVFFRPLYTIQGYASQVDDWISKPANTPPADTITFSMKEGQSTSWSNMGFEVVEGKASASAWCFLKASGHAGSSAENLSLGIDASSSSIEVTITFQGLQALSVGIGAWDVPDLRNLYPTLAPGAPSNLSKGLVKTERVLLGYAPGITVKFDAKTYHAATSIFSSSLSAGGSVTLFGFVVGGSVSGEARSSGSSQFQDVKFDDQSFSITVPPVRSSYPCLVGVLGKKL